MRTRIFSELGGGGVWARSWSNRVSYREYKRVSVAICSLPREEKEK